MIWEENGFIAEVEIIQKHPHAKDTYLVRGAFGEQWVHKNKLKNDITNRTKRDKKQIT